MNIRTRRIAYLALLAALTLVLGYLDAMIPLPLVVPGIKLGLANITVLIALYLLGPRYSIAVMLMKVAITSLLIGSPSMIIYSFAGSVLAFLGMWALWRTDKVNIFAISIVAAVLHNIGQLGVAVIVLQTPALFLNLPIMVIAAVITGGITGTVATGVLKALPPLESEELFDEEDAESADTEDDAESPASPDNKAV